MSKLYLVATPIGNLGDMTYRAVETLKAVDFIAAEDTRVTIKLLNHFEISKPMVSYFQHNLVQRGEEIAQRILNGESCALVTDAGMPAISDPGEELVKTCAVMGIEVVVVPGASAVVSALALSGLPTGRFCFEGFLSTSKKSRREHLESLVNEERTMIFYEAPHKLMNTLKDFVKTFGEDRKISLCRELTKLHEEVLRLNLAEAVAHFEAVSPRGEFVLVIEGKKLIDVQFTLEDAVAMAEKLVANGESPSTAAKQAAADTKIPKSEIYRCLCN